LYSLSLSLIKSLSLIHLHLSQVKRSSNNSLSPIHGGATLLLPSSCTARHHGMGIAPRWHDTMAPRGAAPRWCCTTAPRRRGTMARHIQGASPRLGRGSSTARHHHGVDVAPPQCDTTTAWLLHGTTPPQQNSSTARNLHAVAWHLHSDRFRSGLYFFYY
jgi:hypothetical protein